MDKINRKIQAQAFRNFGKHALTSLNEGSIAKKMNFYKEEVHG